MLKGLATPTSVATAERLPRADVLQRASPHQKYRARAEDLRWEWPSSISTTTMLQLRNSATASSD